MGNVSLNVFVWMFLFCSLLIQNCRLFRIKRIPKSLVFFAEFSIHPSGPPPRHSDDGETKDAKTSMPSTGFLEWWKHMTCSKQLPKCGSHFVKGNVW